MANREILIGNGNRYRVVVDTFTCRVSVFENIEDMWQRLRTRNLFGLSRRAVNKFLGDATGDPEALKQIYKALYIKYKS